MADTWETFIDGLDDASSDFKTEIKGFIRGGLKDSDNFVKRQSKKLVLYLTELAKKKISKKEFKELVGDIRTLTEMHAAMESAVAKKKFMGFAERVGGLVLTSLISAI